MKKESTERLDGFVVLDGNNFNNLKIDGEVTFSNDINAGVLDIDGKIVCKKNASIKSIHLDGVGQFEGDMSVDDKVTIDGKLLLGGNSVKASEIIVDGTVEAAKDIIGNNIEIDGYVDAINIKGKNVSISDWKKNSKVFNSIAKRLFPEKIRISKVENICGESIDISDTKVDTIDGKNISIGKNCEVKRIICEAAPVIHKDSIVGEIVRKTV